MTDKISNERLFPCPFCGGTPGRTGSTITCTNKNCWGPSIWHFANAKDAIAAWNRRQSPVGVEPVAWGESFDGGQTFETISLIQSRFCTFPLYALPPPNAVTITDEMVEKIAAVLMGKVNAPEAAIYDAARAVAALSSEAHNG